MPTSSGSSGPATCREPRCRSAPACRYPSGYPRAQVEARFGALLRAFACGCPPHAGIAPGVDRIVMLLAGVPKLREVTAFPKDARARDLLMAAPAPATAAQLRELGLAVQP